jgi:hypothetical protein
VFHSLRFNGYHLIVLLLLEEDKRRKDGASKCIAQRDHGAQIRVRLLAVVRNGRIQTSDRGIQFKIVALIGQSVFVAAPEI